MTTVRLQKLLSIAGFGSRRQMESWIAEGRVKINGETATLGMQASEKDRIHVNGKLINNPLKKAMKTRILLYHKPIGEICSRDDPNHKNTVFANLPKINKGRWVMVGRLDINTSGLLIFTNDGEFANNLMHPKNEFEREYAVRVHGNITEDMQNSLKNGIELEDGFAKFKSIEFRGGEGTNSWFHVVLTEGRNREVRRLFQAVGVEVSRLIRVRFGQIWLPRDLKRGKSTELSPIEVQNALGAMNLQ